MRIADFDVLPYSLSLTESMVWNGERRHQREGVILCLTAEDGSLGWGEAAPLPGFSSETLDEAISHLERILPVLCGRSLRPEDVARPDSSLHAALDAAGLPASTRYAIDLALLDLGAQTLNRPHTYLLHSDPSVAVPLAGLLVGDAETILEDARQMRHKSLAAVKVKVGRLPLSEEAEVLGEVRVRVGPGVEIRLDANRAWTEEEALEAATAFEAVGASFIEEPLAEPHRLPTFWADSGMAIALDETLAGPNGAEWVRGWVTAVILKPTLVGGVAETLRLARKARRAGVRPILSGSYESGIGTRGLAILAAVTGAEAAGLGTYRYLAEDVLAKRLPLDGATADLPALLGRPPEVTLS